MCGIFGLFSSDTHANFNGRASRALSLLAHRGPDDRGVAMNHLVGGTLMLGQTRLSIIDLSEGGHQPMHSIDGRYSIVFNGEIYNYIELRGELRILGCEFRSDSDTEVLLNCWMIWGAECLSRLRGMFAFSIYDSVTGLLTCVRDAFGIKPLFYRVKDNGVAFASEISVVSALLESKKSLNKQRAYDYLIHGSYDDRDTTFLEDIFHLLPGHMMVFSLNEFNRKQPIEMTRWWWPTIEERTDIRFSDAVDQLRSMFLDNVKLHLRSDVPLGVALSGGLDSSALVSAIRYIEPQMPIHTFSFVARNSSVNEEIWVDQVNQRVGSIAHKIVVEPSEMAADFDDMILAQGEPFAGTSIYAQYRVFKLAKARGIITILDGQGGDEILAGYDGYPSFRLKSLAQSGDMIGFFQFLLNWTRWPGRSIVKALGGFASEVADLRLRQFLLKFKGTTNVTWLNMQAIQSYGGNTQSPFLTHAQSMPKRYMAAALRKAMVGDGLAKLLRHADRNSMRWSIESRVPFLLTDLAEFTLTLPENYLVSKQGESKHLFRKALDGIVPEAIIQRRDKIGFATPEAHWLRTNVSTINRWIDEAPHVSFIDKVKAKHHVNCGLQKDGKFDYSIWRILNFYRWISLNEVQVD